MTMTDFSPDDMTPALRCLVIGAGLGGMTAAIALRRAGHEVTVLEQASEIGRIGAGIQTAPNASRLLTEWGVVDVLGDRAVPAEVSNRRRWQNGALLGSFPMGELLVEHFGAGYLCSHRADLHEALVTVATGAAGPGAPARLLTGRHVSRVDAETGTVWTQDEERHDGDVVIAADGIRSVVRAQLFGERRSPFSGQVTRRMVVDVDRALALDPEVAELIGTPAVNMWLGPGAHAISHPMSAMRQFYLGVTIESPNWTDASSETREQLLERIDGWDPHLRTLVQAGTPPTQWPLYDDAPLDQWIAGRVALMGDACHPMLPFQAQGAAQAMEDGAQLGIALTGIDRDGVGEALAGYAAVRQPRTSRVQGVSKANGPVFHLPDGPEQQARDAGIASGDGADFANYNWLWSVRPNGSPLPGATVELG